MNMVLTEKPKADLTPAERQPGTPRFAGLLSGCRHTKPHWYVAATHPKAERRAHAALHLKGYTAYLPLITSRWRDRTWHTGPLWPGYVFLQLSPNQPWYPIRFAPGVFQLLCINGMPNPCPDGLVEAVQGAEAQRATPTPDSALWAPGAIVALANGIFAGHHAIVTRVSKERAYVALMLFGQPREVPVPLDCLTTCDND